MIRSALYITQPHNNSSDEFFVQNEKKREKQGKNEIEKNFNSQSSFHIQWSQKAIKIKLNRNKNDLHVQMDLKIFPFNEFINRRF